MNIIIGYITIVGLLRLIVYKKNNNRKFVIIAGFLLFIIAALRTIEFGPDVRRYINMFVELPYRNLSDLWMNFLTGTGKDPFFYFFSKLISITGASYQVWLAILSGIFIYSVTKLIHKYSDEHYISYIALISLGYFYFSLTGLRQAMALSMILLSYSPLRERKLVPFIALVIFGSLFHSTALIFLIAYPLVNMKIGFKHILGVGLALSLSVFFSGYIRYLVGMLGWTDTMIAYAVRETSLTYSGFIIQLFIFLFCLFYKDAVLKIDNKNLSLYNLLFLGLIFQAFTTVIAEFFRISMYFSIFSIVLIPKAIAAEKNKHLRVIIYFAVFAALIIYIIWTGSFRGFKFFWSY